MRKALYILGALEDSDIEWMARNGTRLPVPANVALIRQGVPIDSLYILLEGQLSVRVGPTMDREVASLLPGEIVGEISFVDERSPTASVLATRDARVLALPRAELSNKLGRDPAFAARFYRAIAGFLADRLYMTTSRLGYGAADQDDGSEIGDAMMDELSLANIRFDKLLRYLAGEQTAGSFAAVTT